MGLFFGQLRDEKNLEGLLRGMAERSTHSYLLVAGTAGDRHRGGDDYRSVAESLGLQDRVIFDDRHIPDDEVASLVCASDWLPLTYLSTFTSQSGVLNIAAHYDRPVLCAGAPVIRESVDGFPIGVVAAGDSAESLGLGVVEMERRLGDMSPGFSFEEYRRKHSWVENARITRDVYGRVLGMQTN